MWGHRFSLYLSAANRRSAIAALIYSGLVTPYAYADHDITHPGNQVYPANMNSPGYLVNPNGSTNFFYGGWTVDANGAPMGNSLPPGFTADSGAIVDKEFSQRLIRDPSTGDAYIQLIIASDAEAGEGVGEVGMFSESYVRMSGRGISVLQGLHCTPGTGKCPSGVGSLGQYQGSQTSVGIDSLAKIRTGDFEDPREKIRLTQLIYDTDDSSKWADFKNRGTTGTTFYTDIWQAEYSYVDATHDVKLGDFTHVVNKTQDIDEIYSYAWMSAEMQFKLDDRDLEIAQTLGILPAGLREESGFENVNPLYSRISVLSEAENLLASVPGKFSDLDSAVDYINRYIQYRVILQEGWREAEAGLERQDMFQATFQGAVVKAGDVTYRKVFDGNVITAAWEDGDTADHYGVQSVLESESLVQRFGHEQYTPDTCDLLAGDARDKCTQTVRYQFETLDQQPLFSELNFDPSVGHQFLVEDTDNIDPFDPFSTQPHLP